jgi:site-specific recombinase XerD
VPEIHSGLCYLASNREKRVMLAVSIRTARLTTRLMPRIGAHEGQAALLAGHLMKRHIQPVAKAIGIHKKIGWHTFRHSFGTLLKANGEDVETVQELLRHANSRITESRWVFRHRL